MRLKTAAAVALLLAGSCSAEPQPAHITAPPAVRQVPAQPTVPTQLPTPPDRLIAAYSTVDDVPVKSYVLISYPSLGTMTESTIVVDSQGDFSADTKVHSAGHDTVVSWSVRRTGDTWHLLIDNAASSLTNWPDPSSRWMSLTPSAMHAALQSSDFELCRTPYADPRTCEPTAPRWYNDPTQHVSQDPYDPDILLLSLDLSDRYPLRHSITARVELEDSPYGPAVASSYLSIGHSPPHYASYLPGPSPLTSEEAYVSARFEYGHRIDVIAPAGLEPDPPRP